MLGYAVYQENGRSHHQNESDHQPGETAHAPIERRWYAPTGDLVGQLSKKGLWAGVDDDAGGKPANDIGAHKTNIGQIECVAARYVKSMGKFLGRHRLSGERGLIDEKVLCLDQPQIARNHIASRKPHDVAGHKGLDRNLGKFSRIADPSLDTRCRLDQGPQLGRRLVRAMLLDKRGRHREQDHNGDYCSRADIAEKI